MLPDERRFERRPTIERPRERQGRPRCPRRSIVPSCRTRCRYSCPDGLGEHVLAPFLGTGTRGCIPESGKIDTESIINQTYEFCINFNSLLRNQYNKTFFFVKQGFFSVFDIKIGHFKVQKICYKHSSLTTKIGKTKKSTFGRIDSRLCFGFIAKSTDQMEILI
jgi:hypothetical protein